MKYSTGFEGVMPYIERSSSRLRPTLGSPALISPILREHRPSGLVTASGSLRCLRSPFTITNIADVAELSLLDAV
jgi:hypothetical protein